MSGRGSIRAALAFAAILLAAPSPAHAGDGPLRQVGCITDRSGPNCATATALKNAAYLAITPDGTNVYVSARDSDAVAAFSRNRTTGALTQLPAEAGCVTDTGAGATAGCGVSPGLDRPGGIAISSDGLDVYVTGTNSNSLVAFGRDPASGALQPAGCFTLAGPTQIAGCTPASGLGLPVGVALSPDGSSLYVASSGSDAVAYFSRDQATGALTQLGCFANTATQGCTGAPGLDGANWVAVSGDGLNVYVSAPAASAISSFARDPATGALSSLGCISGNDGFRQDPKCAGGHEMEFMQYVAVAPGGAQVYGSATDRHSLIIFQRDPGTGALSQIGCLSDFTDGAGECDPAVGLSLLLGIAITPDGRNVYTGAFGRSSVASFRRDPATGLLDQFGPCISSGDTDCDTGNALTRAGFVALSPDNRHLYVNAPSNNAVAIFARSTASTAPVIGTDRAKVVKGTVPISLSCPPDADGGCVGHLGLTIRRSGVRFKLATYDLLAGEQGTVAVAVRKADAKRLRQLRRFSALAVAAGLEPGDEIIGSSRRISVNR